MICYPHLLFANLPSHTIPWSFADSISIYICTTYVFEPSFSDRPIYIYIYIYTIMLCCLYKLWISILCWTVIFGHTHTHSYILYRCTPFCDTSKSYIQIPINWNTLRWSNVARIEYPRTKWGFHLWENHRTKWKIFQPCSMTPDGQSHFTLHKH